MCTCLPVVDHGPEQVRLYQPGQAGAEGRRGWQRVYWRQDGAFGGREWWPERKIGSRRGWDQLRQHRPDPNPGPGRTSIAWATRICAFETAGADLSKPHRAVWCKTWNKISLLQIALPPSPTVLNTGQATQPSCSNASWDYALRITYFLLF